MTRPSFEDWTKAEIADLRAMLVTVLEINGVDYEPLPSAAPAPLVQAVADAVDPALEVLCDSLRDHAGYLQSHAEAINAHADRGNLIAKTQDVKIVHRDQNGDISLVETVTVSPE